MGMSVSTGGGVKAEPNVTPMIDVMLVLLIIFMITAPLMAHKVKVELPTASLDKKPEILVPPVTVAVSSNGDVFWNDQPMGSVSDPQGLKNRLEVNLATNLAREPQPQVDIRADEDTKYEKIKTVVTIIRESGMRKVGFVSMPERN